MTKNKSWQMLRGGAGYLMGSCFTAFCCFSGLVCSLSESAGVGALGLVIPCLMMVIGAEEILWLALALTDRADLAR